MAAPSLKEKFQDWEFECEDCKEIWRSANYQCPKCESLNTKRTLKWDDQK